MILGISRGSPLYFIIFMLIDTHSHINFNAYKDDFKQVIARSLANNVWMINIGTKYETSKRAIEIAKNYKQGVYAAIGFHPLYSQEEEFNCGQYKELTKNKKVVAIGEIGLDYYYKPKTKIRLKLFKEKQKEVLLKQLDLAKELNLPVIFHCRMGHQDLIDILNEQLTTNNEQIMGVIHCFTGNWEQAKKYLEIGLFLGFNGIIFKDIKGINFKEIIKKIPLEKIFLETDCPYLMPLSVEVLAKPGSSSIRNEPIYIEYIAQEIAKIKNISFKQVAEITSKNAKNLFKI